MNEMIYPASSFGSAIYSRPKLSSIKCCCCGKGQELVVSAEDLDKLTSGSVKIMFDTAEIFEIGFACSKCMKKGKK